MATFPQHDSKKMMAIFEKSALLGTVRLLRKVLGNKVIGHDLIFGSYKSIQLAFHYRHHEKANINYNNNNKMNK